MVWRWWVFSFWLSCLLALPIPRIKKTLSSHILRNVMFHTQVYYFWNREFILWEFHWNISYFNSCCWFWTFLWLRGRLRGEQRATVVLRKDKISTCEFIPPSLSSSCLGDDFYLFTYLFLAFPSNTIQYFQTQRFNLTNPLWYFFLK